MVTGSNNVVGSFVTPLSDDAVPEQYRVHVPAWRRLAAEFEYAGSVVYQVRKGFTLKNHCPKAGPVHQNWSRLQDWPLQNDEPTQDLIVFWIPRLLSGSVWKDVKEQKIFLGAIRTYFELPEHHLSIFGSAALLAALIQAHFKCIDERTPLNGHITRTDTLHVDGCRLFLFWHNGELNWDDLPDYRLSAYIGVFPLGVEALGNLEA